MPKNKHKGASFFPSNQSSGRQGKSLFFGVGINDYQHFDKLNNAVRDVNDVLALLEERYVVNEKIILLNEEATKENITDQLEDLVDLATPEDKVIIYYSGHGFLKNETGYWIPVDARPGRRGRFIGNEVILRCIKDIPAKHTLLISDSCFSGALVTREVQKSDIAISELEKDKSRWVLSSGRETEKVADGSKGKNSPFATSILKVLRDNQQSKINVGILADKVIKLTRYNWKQMPQSSPLFGAGHQGGQYVFYLKETVPDWQKAWQRVESYPESTLHELTSKIHLLDEYTEEFENAENIEKAYEKGNYLEQKRAFFMAKSSLFKLKQFARRKTPFREEARELIAEMKKGFVLPEEPEPEPTPKLAKKKPPANRKKDKPLAEGQTGQFTDARDGQIYKTIQLNGKTWLAQNLNFDVGKDCWFHSDDPKNGEKYGRLYTWEAAQKACPPGWRLPSDEEWRGLAMKFGGLWDGKDINDPKKSYKALLAGGSSGLAALLGGTRDPNGTFNDLGTNGGYWSGTEKDTQGAWYYDFDSYNGKLYRFSIDKAYGFSCRCLKD